MENEIVETAEVNVTLDTVKKAALTGAATALASVVVSKLATVLIEKGAKKFADRRNKKTEDTEK
jgi:hypothetical protein